MGWTKALFSVHSYKNTGGSCTVCAEIKMPSFLQKPCLLLAAVVLVAYIKLCVQIKENIVL